MMLDHIIEATKQAYPDKTRDEQVQIAHNASQRWQSDIREEVVEQAFDEFEMQR